MLSLVLIFTLTGPRGAAALGAHSGALALLAFCRRGVGGGLHRGLHRGKVMAMAEIRTTRDQEHAGGRQAIHLPAPTAWPIVLAFGCTLAAAGLVTNTGDQRPGRRCLCLPGASDGFARCCRTSSTRKFPSWSSRSRLHRRARWCERIRLSPEHRAHLPVETYPDHQRHQGRHCRRYCDDFAGTAVRTDRAAQHLVSGESAGRRGRGALAQSHHGRDRRISLAGAARRHLDPLRDVPAGRACFTAPCCRCCRRHPVLLGGILAPVLWTGVAALVHGNHQSRARSSASRGDGFWFRR